MSGEAIVLVSHGARDRAWAGPLERLAELLRSRRQGGPVAIAFLECMEPKLRFSVDALYQDGARVVRVIPLFLGAGGHVVRDVGRQLSAVRASRPDLRIELEPAVGERAAVIAAIADAILGPAIN